MAVGDLTNLANAKQWILQQDSEIPTSDTFISGLIRSSSQFIYTYLSRDSFLKTTRTLVCSGNGSYRIVLPNWPVLSVASVTINGSSVTAANALVSGVPPNNGWYLEASDTFPPASPQEIRMVGWCFARGIQNIQIVYTSGYAVLGETQTITQVQPNPTVTALYQIDTTQPYGSFSRDEGVTFADGTALTPVASNPAQGQYALSPTVTGRYLFNAADVNKSVLISYSYTPSDLEQCCIELVSERFFYANRVGLASKQIATQTTASYRNEAVNPYMESILNQYRNVVPF